MKLARVGSRTTSRLKRTSGLRFRTAAVTLKAFARAAGPIEVSEVGQETVETF